MSINVSRINSYIFSVNIGVDEFVFFDVVEHIVVFF